LEVYEVCGRAGGFRFQKVREALFEFIIFNYLSEGHRDSDFLNLMLEIKRRCRLWEFSNFGNMTLDNWREGLGLLTSVIVCYFISRPLCSGGQLRNIRRCFPFVGS
jgi:hypothetical protein